MTSNIFAGPIPQAESSLADRAYEVLEEQIVTLTLKPGEVLSEQALSASLKIGRTPVREALHRLAAEHLVTILPRRGILVTEINLTQQMQLLETRRELERLIARRAAKRRSAAQAEEFAALADGFHQTAENGDDVAFMRHDNAFNHLLVAACDNPFAANALRMMQGLSRRFWFVHYKQHLDLPRCARLHENIARAIVAGEEDKAAAASDALIAYIAEFARATL